MENNKTLLITGGCGFIGSNLVRSCLQPDICLLAFCIEEQ